MAGPGPGPGVLSELNTMRFTLPLPFFPPSPPTIRRPVPLTHPGEVQGEEVIQEGCSVCLLLHPAPPPPWSGPQEVAWTASFAP